MYYIVYDETIITDLLHKKELLNMKIYMIPTNTLSLCNIIVCLSAKIDNLLKYSNPIDHELIKNLHYKDKFAQYMIDNNFGQYIPDTYKGFPKKIPYIIKPIDGFGGINVKVFNELKNIKYNNSFIVQDYVKHKITSVGHFLCNDGNIIINKIYCKPNTEFGILTTRIANYKKREISEFELTVFSKIFKKIKYNGICCVDYYYHDYDDLKIFEINPRVGSSLYHDKDDFLLFINKLIEIIN